MAPRNTLLLLFILLFFSCSFACSAFAEERDAWVPKGRVGLLGVGLMQFGMPVSQAVRILGVTLIEDRATSGDPDICYFIHPNGKSEPISFLVREDKVVRVDVSSSKVKTVSGLGVGSLEKDLLKRWPKQLQRRKHPVDPKRRYLEFVPLAKHEKNYRMIFETDGTRVIRFRVGLLPGVANSDGCS